MAMLQQSSTAPLGAAQSTTPPDAPVPGEAAPGPETAAPGPEVEEEETAAGGETTEEEQAEYERVLGAVERVLYQEEATSKPIEEMLRTDESKIDGVVSAALMVISEVDKQLDMDDVVIAEITQDTVDRLIEMSEAKGAEWSEQETQGALGATWEGVMEMFGVDEEDYNQMTGEMSEEDFKSAEQTYKGFLGE